MTARSWYAAVAFGLLSAVVSNVAEASKLRGSASSMRHQHEVAIEDELTFLDSRAEVQRLVAAGGLEELAGNGDYSLSSVSFPYARPEVRVFVERLASRYRAATGEPLVVTSLTRPSSLQPRNAHELSVHPAGMAVDFRIPRGATGRAWMEKNLLALEHAGVLDVTREKNPPHYHVAVFSKEYRTWVQKADSVLAAAPPVAPVAAAQPGVLVPTAAAEPVGAPTDTDGRRGVALVLALVALVLPAAVIRRRAT